MHIEEKKNKKKYSSTGVSVNFLEFLRAPFLRRSLVTASEDDDETKLLDMTSRLTNVIFGLFVINYFVNPSK